jgi:peptide/nickel transport system ATP-binding protein
VTEPSPVIDIRNLTVALPSGADRPFAIEDVSFSLLPQEVLCIVGESGSGKSLTSQAIMGLLAGPEVHVASGSIHFDGRDIAQIDEREMQSLRGVRIAMIFQEPMTALNPVMRVGDQIAEMFRFHGRAHEAAGRVEELLGAVGLPDPASIKDAYPFRLSGGQRQRVMIAMALALDPAVLIADEPTTALDVMTQKQILALIKQLQRARRTSCLFITHDFGVVAEIADRVGVMQSGKLVEIGAARDVLERPQHAYTKRLIAAVPRLEPPERAPLTGRRTIVDVKGVEKTYASRGGWLKRRPVHAVKDASFSVRSGETLAIVGQSGSGKSTLARCLVRLVDADAGSMTLDGADGDLLAMSKSKFHRHRPLVQMVFQDPYASLNPRHRIGDIVAKGLIAHGHSRDAARARVLSLLDLVRLDASAADRYPHEFSGGQRQRIGIARALALEPKLLVADEPVSALDVSIQAQVLELLAEIQKRLDLAVLFITHDLRVAAQIADTVAVMHQGEIVERGPARQIFLAPQHDYTRALIAAIPGRAWLAPSDRNTRQEVTS